jgi:hypothetical protein
MADVRCSRCGILVPRDQYAAHVPCRGQRRGAQATPGEAVGWGSPLLPPGHLQRQGALPGMAQPPEPLPPHVAGSDTSRAAAESLRPHLAGLNARVYAAVESAGEDGRTCDEVEVLMDGRHQTISSRIRHLVQIGCLVDSGRRRRTRSGRTARVYVVR